MKINNEKTITFTEEDIKNLVAAKVEQGGYKVTDIKVNLINKKRTEGHGYGEIDYEVLILENIQVKAEIDTSI